MKGSTNSCWDVFRPKREGGSEDIYWAESHQRNASFLAPGVSLLLGKYCVFPGPLLLVGPSRSKVWTEAAKTFGRHQSNFMPREHISEM